MYPAEDGTRAPSEVESIVSLCVKHLDGADQPTRSAVAQLAGHMLASTQVERVLPPSDPSKRSKKSGDEQDEEEKPTPAALGIATEVKLIMTPNEMLSQLSNHFNKPQTSHKTRLGLISCYIAVLSILGPSFVERNYTLIVGHFMSEIVSHASNTGSRHGILFVRSLVKLVFRDLIGVRMLNEQAQILAIQELSTAYLKRWPAMLPGQTAPGPLVLAIALQEVAGLVQQLGNAPPPVQVRHYFFKTNASSPSTSGRIVRSRHQSSHTSEPYSQSLRVMDSAEFLLFDASSTSQDFAQSR